MANSHFTPDNPDPEDLATAIHIALGLTYGDGSGDVASSLTGANVEEKGMGEYKQALALEPDSPLANLYYAHGLQENGDTSEANAAFKKAAAMSTGDIRKAAEDKLR